MSTDKKPIKKATAKKKAPAKKAPAKKVTAKKVTEKKPVAKKKATPNKAAPKRKVLPAEKDTPDNEYIVVRANDVKKKTLRERMLLWFSR